MPVPQKLKQRIKAGLPANGFWINLFDPAVAQIAALAGYDWVMLDLEHNPFSECDVGALIAALAPETPVVVRVRGNGEEHIKWPLDAGAAGVIVPGIDGVEDARRAVEYSKYHPLGMRGFGPNRATDYWTRGREYIESANNSVLTICQIELAGALEAVEDICALEGVDGIWIGPGDLSQSLGYLAEPGRPEVVAAIDHVIDVATARQVAWGIPTATVEDYVRYTSRGAVLMTLGSDTRVLLSGARDLVAGAARRDAP